MYQIMTSRTRRWHYYTFGVLILLFRNTTLSLSVHFSLAKRKSFMVYFLAEKNGILEVPTRQEAAGAFMAS